MKELYFADFAISLTEGEPELNDVRANIKLALSAKTGIKFGEVSMKKDNKFINGQKFEPAATAIRLVLKSYGGDDLADFKRIAFDQIEEGDGSVRRKKLAREILVDSLIKPEPELDFEVAMDIVCGMLSWATGIEAGLVD